MAKQVITIFGAAGQLGRSFVERLAGIAFVHELEPDGGEILRLAHHLFLDVGPRLFAGFGQVDAGHQAPVVAALKKKFAKR